MRNQVYLKKSNQYLNCTSIIKKRYTFLIGFILFLMFLLFVSLLRIQILQKTKFDLIVDKIQNPIVEGESAPRGRIYDRNHVLLVDNKPVKTIVYKKQSGISKKKEVELAYLLASMIDLSYTKLALVNLKEFWLTNHYEEGKTKITEEEWKLFEERKLSLNDIESLKMERITEKELSIYGEVDLEAAYLYYLMNKGYSYAEKTIKKDVTDSEYAIVSEHLEDLPGFFTRLDWEREYLYGSVFRSILGSISSSETGVPRELKEEYLKNGYSLNDRVGISNLEFQYEEYLRGTKDQFLVSSTGENKLVRNGSRGKDIVLTIDIELQKAIEEILVEQIKLAKQEPNTEYYNHSFVVVEEPNTGDILAMAGKQVLMIDGEYKVYDYTPGITTSPVVVGSVIKGASQIVGYNTGALQIGEVRDDSCIKIASTPKKCSYHYHGFINDIEALKYSSNTYQFRTAIKVGGGIYSYNGPLSLDENAFSIYRNTFHEFGLGVKTGIDLPVESLGYIGKSTLSGYLLDFSIGQYDTYTPIQLSQYISTIATKGVRIQPHLLKAVYLPTEEPLTQLFYEFPTTVLGTVQTEEIYMDRVQMGLREVLRSGGTGAGSVSLEYDPAGKTGTSESFLDTDGDGVIDTETVTNTFAVYAPFDHPRVAFTVVSPDVTHFKNKTLYQTMVNRKISREVTKKFFEIYQ